MDSSKKIYRDSLFRDYFRDKENFVQLCNVVTGLNLKAEQLSENNVDDILFSNLRNDVSFSAGENCFVFFEHQSTRNFNMPLRMLFYLSLLYRGSIKEDLIYRTRIIKLPAPKFFVFYNGKEPCPEESTLKLSDAFSMTGDVELTVKVYNINYNKNFNLIRECRSVHDYSCFIDRVAFNLKIGMSRDEAIISAMKWCIENDVMRNYLSAHMKEVFFMVNLIWNEEDAKRSYIAQGREEGLAEGLAEGERITTLKNIRNLMVNFHLTAEAAMSALSISLEMQRELAPLI
ncbi:MAG: Rpn family recombination-promoting nuclease/putative transposase [Selenomonadaceae bacterium]|nr:Rpn family recombination-promoting nuclease/putative transposase [Selenomonadaceae bacterium]